MRISIAVALLVLAPACSASLEDPANTGIGATFDSGTGTAEDASVGGTDSGATPDAAPVCTVAKSVYLNFEGQTLTRAATSDATQNQAAWMNKATGTAPKFRDGVGTRAADIVAITDGVKAQVTGLGVEVVTTRPVAGPYVMVVFGGTAGQIGSNFGRAVQKLDCGNLVMSDVAWISDAPANNQVAINNTLGAIGFGLGLTATTDTDDCMCGWDNACTQTTGACTLATTIARDPAANQTCPNVSSQNEQAAFTAGFCP